MKHSVLGRAPRVAVVGGGIAGSSVALKLAESGVNVHLLEQGSSLVNGPPACHLHAGGNLYRDISLQQCFDLLEQSIATVQCFPLAVNHRPTVIAIPQHDSGSSDDLLPRLEALQQRYAQLVANDPDKQCLGDPNEYYQLFDAKDLSALAQQEPLAEPKSLAEWLIPVAKQLDLTQFKLPLVVVQEYGLSLLRIAATVQLAAESLDNCQVALNSKVLKVQRCDAHLQQGAWLVEYQTHGKVQQIKVDYLVNACGYQSGHLDDMAGFSRQRMVEFKAAYLATWPQQQTQPWPELIVHGQRGTPQGMAQLTPYPNGLFQLHGMTENITLFEGGLVASSENSAQPLLSAPLIRKLNQGWDEQEVAERTQRAVSHMAQYLPALAEAKVAGKPLFGAQQIPGTDPSLRAAGVSFSDPYYARTEIVKFSSAMPVAKKITEHLVELSWLGEQVQAVDEYLVSTQKLSYQAVLEQAQLLAEQRAYPRTLAGGQP